MFNLCNDLHFIKLTQIKMFKLFVPLFFVITIASQMNLKDKSDAEAIIYTIKTHYLDMMSKHSDWLKRILGVVKLELTYRQMVGNCTNDTCLYSIKLSQPYKHKRYRRSERRKNRYFKPNKMVQIKEESYIDIPHIDSPIMEEEIISMIPDILPKSSEIHMSECKGKYIYYCKNGAKCVYIDLLQEAVCICSKGFTGKRCVDFSLSDTVQSLRDFEMKTVNISIINKKDRDAILSVMDATARFTYEANLIKSDAVKDILDMSQTDN